MSNTKTIEFTVNGAKKQIAVGTNEKLITLLRRMGFKGVKRGCDEGLCGACTIILDGQAVNCCLLYAWQASGRSIETIEGVGTFDQPHPFQTAMVEEAGVQCGFCTPGIIMSVKALIDKNPAPDMKDVRVHLDGNYCRCTGYEKIENAVRRVVGEVAAKEVDRG
jgi:carbon-monoxide dehydrogenase small subunit